jgi:hypothetical protein
MCLKVTTTVFRFFFPPTLLFPIFGIRVSQQKTLKAERAASCPFNIRETRVRRSAMLGKKVEIIGLKDKDFMYT